MHDKHGAAVHGNEVGTVGQSHGHQHDRYHQKGDVQLHRAHESEDFDKVGHVSIANKGFDAEDDEEGRTEKGQCVTLVCVEHRLVGEYRVLLPQHGKGDALHNDNTQVAEKGKDQLGFPLLCMGIGQRRIAVPFGITVLKTSIAHMQDLLTEVYYNGIP